MKAQIDGKFDALWKRMCRYPVSEGEAASTLREWAEQMGVTVQFSGLTQVGRFQPTLAIVLATPEREACFPLSSPEAELRWQQNLEASNQEALLWEKVEWFGPLWVPRANTMPLLQDVKYRGREEAIALFDYHMSTVYTVPFQAVCIAQLLPKSRSLSGFVPLLREAYLAFYSGYKAASIAALIPVFEGAIKKISGASASAHVSHEIDRIFERACMLAADLHYDGRWVPDSYRTVDYLFGQDELIFVFETYKRWLKNTFFQDTTKYDGATWLNRHLFAHGVSSQWQQMTNFSRLIVSLATLGVIESWHDDSNQVSLFFPAMDENGTLLWQQALLRASHQMWLKDHELKEFQKHGRLVPELSSDDGLLLRTARLMEGCMNDVVRPMRDAGWSVSVGEPESNALYVVVSGSSGDVFLHVALLFSCATDNKIYKELSETVDVVVYMGAPYHQQSYAFGVDIHVGPAAGWQPPKAPDR